MLVLIDTGIVWQEILSNAHTVEQYSALWLYKLQRDLLKLSDHTFLLGWKGMEKESQIANHGGHNEKTSIPTFPESYSHPQGGMFHFALDSFWQFHFSKNNNNTKYNMFDKSSLKTKGKAKRKIYIHTYDATITLSILGRRIITEQ